MMAELQVLGCLQVELRGSRIDLPQLRERRVMAMLILNANIQTSIDHLIGTLWEDPPATARQQVYTIVASLRRSLTAAESEIRLDAMDHLQARATLRVPGGIDPYRNL